MIAVDNSVKIAWWLIGFGCGILFASIVVAVKIRRYHMRPPKAIVPPTFPVEMEPVSQPWDPEAPDEPTDDDLDGMVQRLDDGALRYSAEAPTQMIEALPPLPERTDP